VCAASSAATVARAATVALGPVMHEVRLQISSEHKTRIRLWQSDDPAVGGRLEFAHRIGVLEPRTEVATRWVLGDGAAADAADDSYVLFSEDNGYEKIPHRAGTGADRIPQNVFPSQMSAYMMYARAVLCLIASVALLVALRSPPRLWSRLCCHRRCLNLACLHAQYLLV
jgi:hypothetical protein